MSNIYDIAVIGAGPAGSTAAKSAAAAGAKVCIFERNATPGTPVRCGEGIGMRSLMEFSAARPEWIKCEITRSVMVSPNGTKVLISDIDSSVVLDRERMDGDLVKEAVKAGAELLVSTPILTVKRMSNGLYECISPTATYTAKIIILADGVESRLARLVGWNTHLLPKDIQSCAFTRVYSPLIEQKSCIFYVGTNIAPGGYAWVFSRGSGEANVGLGILGRNSTAGSALSYLKKFIDNEFPGSRTGEMHSGGVPVAKSVTPLVKEGVMLVGDAARQVNCTSGAGIAYSLFAGTAAGRVAAEALADGRINLSHLASYEQLWKKRFGKQQHRSYALKEFIINHASDSFLNRVAKALVKKKPGKTRYVTVFLATFSKHPLLMYKAFKLFK